MYRHCVVFVHVHAIGFVDCIPTYLGASSIIHVHIDNMYEFTCWYMRQLVVCKPKPSRKISTDKQLQATCKQLSFMHTYTAFLNEVNLIFLTIVALPQLSCALTSGCVRRSPTAQCRYTAACACSQICPIHRSDFPPPLRPPPS